MIRAAYFSGALLLVATSIPQALAFSCFDPSPPYCVADYGRFDTDTDFEICRSDMERYQRQVNDYRECVAREAREKMEDSLRRYNRAVDDFNRRARGGY